MRLFARHRGIGFRGSAHSLRSAYNQFTLVEPFPNGKLYFKRVVDRPLCVYVIEDKLFILAARLLAFAIAPVGDGCFHLESRHRLLSPGEYLDGETCVPALDWPEAKAWETFRLAAPPDPDERERRTIAHIDRFFARFGKDSSAGAAAIETDVLACLAATSRAADLTDLAIADLPPPPPAKAGRTNAAAARAGCFNGSVDLCQSTHAAGWSACGLEAAVVTVYVNGTRVGEARPSGERPDVAAAGYARHSAWSFVFPRPLQADDRLAFRFPDGSPVRSAQAEAEARHVHAWRRGDVPRASAEPPQIRVTPASRAALCVPA